jgi:hypothetical protein
MSLNLADELLGKTPNARERKTARQAGELAPAAWEGEPIRFTISGQPCSKANSRKIVTLSRGKEHERTAVVKSKEALQYERDALLQIPPRFRLRLEGPVFVKMTIWYASEQSDLDESLILDCLQDRWKRYRSVKGRDLLQCGVYRNDRQVREKWIKHAIDRANPRAEIEVAPLAPQQAPLL